MYTLNTAATVRRVTEGNKKFIVVPTTILLPKVLRGSKGNLYYPPEEIAKSVQSWNGIPLITPAHPTLNGQPILGMSPQAWARFEVGRFYGSTLNNKGGIDGESWFDEEEVRAKEPRLLDRLNSKLNIDVSTGLRHSLEFHEKRVHEGKEYEATVRNFRPDHIAVLMDEKGACSTSDGCGIVFNSMTDETVIIQPIDRGSDMEKDQLVNWLVLNCDCWKDTTDKETLNSMTVEKLKKLKEKAQEAIRNSGVVNAVTNSFGQEILTLNSADAITAKIKEKAVPTPVEKPVEKVVTVVTNATPVPITPTPVAGPTMDMSAWLAAMPSEAKPVWNNMVASLNKEKEHLCMRLTDATTNSSQDEKVRKPVFDNYAKLDIEVLRGLASGIQQQTNNHVMMPTVPSYGNAYAGQSGMILNHKEPEPEPLGLATRNAWNWSDNKDK